MTAALPEGWQVIMAPGSRSRTSGNGGNGSSAYGTAYDEDEKVVSLEGLLHGDDEADHDCCGHLRPPRGWWLLDGPRSSDWWRLSSWRPSQRIEMLGIAGMAAVTLVLAVWAVGARHCASADAGPHCAPLRWAAAAVGRGGRTADEFKGGFDYRGLEIRRPGGSECNDLLGVDRVALMFLSLGALPQDTLWNAWLDGASYLLPLQPLQARGCNMTGVREACSESRAAIGRDGQFLFSFYNHARPSFDAQPMGSVLFGRMVPRARRIETAWGSPNNSVAERLMLREALKEPRNQLFVLLSDSGVPLYPPTAVYQHLMGISKSRIDACKPAAPWEWNDGLMEGNNLTRAHWRKSTQFWAITRPHAALLAWEEPLFEAFRKHCISTWGGVPGRWYQCYTSESYFATALSLHGREDETDCLGRLISADWSRKGAHPKTYAPEDVTIDLFRRSRQDNARNAANQTRICEDDAAIQLAARGFVNIDAWHAASAVTTCEADAYQWDPALLGPLCPLVGRKFTKATAEAVYKLLWLEEDGLDIFPPGRYRPPKSPESPGTGAGP